MRLNLLLSSSSTYISPSLPPQGKVYYYHTVTRKSQWERPTEQDAEGTITMELATPEHEKSPDREEKKEKEDEGSEGAGLPQTPEGSPPPTPTEEEEKV